MLRGGRHQLLPHSCVLGMTSNKDSEPGRGERCASSVPFALRRALVRAVMDVEEHRLEGGAVKQIRLSGSTDASRQLQRQRRSWRSLCLLIR